MDGLEVYLCQVPRLFFLHGLVIDFYQVPRYSRFMVWSTDLSITKSTVWSSGLSLLYQVQMQICQIKGAYLYKVLAKIVWS